VRLQKIAAASREAKALVKWKTRQELPSPSERWIEKEARYRPQAVECVAGETTNLPMEMSVEGIYFNHDRR